jgi:hypothetical protein
MPGTGLHTYACNKADNAGSRGVMEEARLEDYLR